MHEPGPPRATSVGESVELAPRSPDPDGTYEWSLRDSPAGSDGDVLSPGQTSRPDAPVVHLRPDAPGTYVLTLDAPDGTHRQRVRAYPDERRPVELRVPAADLPVDDGDVDRVSLLWSHNDRLLARDRPERDGDDWVYEAQVPPGRHGFGFVANDDRATEYGDEALVPGPGRPRVSLSAAVIEGDETDPFVQITAETAAPPDVDGEGEMVGTDGEGDAVETQAESHDEREQSRDQKRESRVDAKRLRDEQPRDAEAGNRDEQGLRFQPIPKTHLGLRFRRGRHNCPRSLPDRCCGRHRHDGRLTVGSRLAIRRLADLYFGNARAVSRTVSSPGQDPHA